MNWFPALLSLAVAIAVASGIDSPERAFSFLSGISIVALVWVVAEWRKELKPNAGAR